MERVNPILSYSIYNIPEDNKMCNFIFMPHSKEFTYMDVVSCSSSLEQQLTLQLEILRIL